MGIFTQLRKLASEKQQAASDAYEDLVRVAAVDGKYQNDKAVEVIEEAAKTFDEFSRDVERMAQRIADANALRDAKDGLADFQAADARLAELRKAERAELEAVRQKYDELRTEEQLKERTAMQRLNTLYGQRDAARQRLIATADPAIDAEENVVKERIRQHQHHCRRLVHKRQAMMDAVSTLEHKFERFQTSGERNQCLAEIRRLKKEIHQLAPLIQQAHTVEAQALQDELAAVIDKKLLP